MSTAHTTHHVDNIPLTRHAWQRLSGRGIGRAGVMAALDHGREILDRGGSVFFIGRKEVARAKRRGIQIAQHAGIHVVCAHDGHIITMYRNRNPDIREARRYRRAKAA